MFPSPRGGWLLKEDKMMCCAEMDRAMDRDALVKREMFEIRDGRILNEVDTEYFIRTEDMNGVASYFGINYCPFCGRPLSRGLWAAEKKK
jgi:hypothetical protein